MNIDIGLLIIVLFPLLMAITLHEAAHAWAAHKLGDHTAYMLKRVSLSPLRHIDPLGTIIVPILLWLLSKGTFTFGWAKPVPINLRALKNLKRDSSLIAFAGPAANMLMAVLWGIIAVLMLKTTTHGINYGTQTMSTGLILMGYFGFHLNIILAVLNLLPIPPLDGGKIATNWLPYQLSQSLMYLEPFCFFIIFILMYANLLDLSAISSFFWNHFILLFG